MSVTGPNLYSPGQRATFIYGIFLTVCVQTLKSKALSSCLSNEQNISFSRKRTQTNREARKQVQNRAILAYPKDDQAIEILFQFS